MNLKKAKKLRKEIFGKDKQPNIMLREYYEIKHQPETGDVVLFKPVVNKGLRWIYQFRKKGIE